VSSDRVKPDFLLGTAEKIRLQRLLGWQPLQVPNLFTKLAYRRDRSCIVPGFLLALPVIEQGVGCYFVTESTGIHMWRSCVASHNRSCYFHPTERMRWLAAYGVCLS